MESGKIALLIIDQQQGIDDPKLGERNNPRAEDVMLTILFEWRALGWPIFHIRHRSTEPQSVFWPDQDGYEFKQAFLPLESERVITKSVPCAFTNNRLGSELDEMGVNEIVIVGVATNNSVEATGRTAGNLGLRVHVAEDACFTFAKHDYFGELRSAKDVHAMSLANLQDEYAAIASSEAIIKLAKSQHQSVRGSR